jgi:broad specificity phosphatase PhoE
MESKKYLIFIRHGERKDRVGEKVLLHPCDPELTEKGKKYCCECGKELKNELKKLNIDLNRVKLLSSPFFRALQTSKEFLNGLNLPQTIYIDNNLCEYFFEKEFKDQNPFEFLSIISNEKKEISLYKNEMKDCKLILLNSYELLPKKVEIREDVVKRLKNYIPQLKKDLYEDKENDAYILVTHACPIHIICDIFNYPKQYENDSKIAFAQYFIFNVNKNDKNEFEVNTIL